MRGKNWRTTVGAAGVVALAGAAYGQQLDQEQLLYNGGMSARTLPGYTVWQSFTAGVSGRLTQIDMGFFNSMSGDGVLRVYAGSGTAGSLLQERNVPVVGVTQTPVTWNSWAVDVAVTAGLVYTFELTPNALSLPDPYGVCVGATDPYSGGDLGLDDPSGSYETPFDAVFRTWVSGGSPCGSADFNCDGDVATDADIEAFFECVAGECPGAPCMSTADFNGDGDVATDADIEAFFRVLAGGNC